MTNPQPPRSPNVLWHHATVTRADRERLNGHRSVMLWFTGLSGSGKSTIAHAVEDVLFRQFPCSCGSENCRGWITGRKEQTAGYIAENMTDIPINKIVG